MRSPLPFAAALLAAAGAPSAVRAQSPAAPSPPASPAAKASPAASASPGASPAPAAKTRTVVLTPERPGTYSYWVVGESGKGSVATLGPGQAGANVLLSEGAESIQVLDDTSGTVASLDVAKAKDGAKLSLSPAAFTLLRSVAVKVTAGGGKPVEKAVVTLTDASGVSREQVLTAAEAGVARFENVPMGKATVSAAYGEGGAEKATQETAVSPTKGGGALEVTLALSGNVPTLEAPAAGAGGALPLPGANGAPGSPSSSAAPQQPQTIVVNAGQQEAPRSNDWIAGVIGIALLGAGGAYLYRYAKARGITVKDALKQIGVDTPQEVSVAAGGLRPATPVAPPLPSLSELPAAGPAAASAGMASAPGSGHGPRLVGLGGPVQGAVYPLAGAGVSVGRDAENTVPLPADKTASRRHARFAVAGAGAFEVIDEGSSNGTFVNGQRIAGRQSLSPGDEVQVGSARFRFER